MSEPSLVDKVAGLIGSRAPALENIFRRTFKLPSGGDEVKALNNYFRVELSKAEVSTTDERSTLIDGVPPDKWIKYFEVHVLPTLVRFSLPKE